MSECVLLISSNTHWREALTEEFGLAGTGVLSCGIDSAKLDGYLTKDCTAAVIWTESDSAAAPGGRYATYEKLIRRMRDARRDYPVIFFSVVPDDELTAMAKRHPPSTVVYDVDVTMDRVAALCAAWQRLKRPAVFGDSAMLDITIGSAQISFEARVDEQVVDRGKQPWLDRFHIDEMNKRFAFLDDHPEVFRRSWEQEIGSASRTLWHSIIETQPGVHAALEELKFDNIHFPFVVESGDLEHIPFEVVAYGDGKDEYIRYAAPIARKLLLKPNEVLGDAEQPRLIERKNHRAVLFIMAAASGVLRVTNKTFDGKDCVLLRKLDHLGAERQAVLDVYGLDQVHSVDLTNAADPVGEMTTALQQGPWDVIHFAGHSVQADQDRQVFLALPGAHNRSELIGYSGDDFARRAAQANARLVVLSSCESASCRTLLRMTSLGVPALIGFRWPVDDEDAKVFTPRLHEALHQRKLTLARAFRDALFELKERAGGRVTPFSPILLIQPDSWPSYYLGEN
jgi:hypothetical protein